MQGERIRIRMEAYDPRSLDSGGFNTRGLVVGGGVAASIILFKYL